MVSAYIAFLNRALRAAPFALAALAAACSGGEEAPPTALQAEAPAADASAATPAATPPPGLPAGAYFIDDIEPGKKGGKLVIAMASDPKTFNPVISDDASSTQLHNFVFDSLYGYDVHRQSDEPAAATSWEYDEALREWTFRLREGMKWSDGAPVTSSDFLFFTECVRHPDVPSHEKEYFKTDGKEFEFSAPDPLTFKAKIPDVDSFAILNLGLVRALPRHKYEAALKAGRFQEVLGTNTPPEEIVSSGPFRIKEYRSGDRVVLEANPDYYQFDSKGTRLPYVDELVMLNVENFDAMALRFQAGDLDLLEDVLPSSLSSLEDGAAAGNYTMHNAGLAMSVNHYWFNMKPGGSYDGEDGKRAHWTPSAPGEAPPADILAKNYRPYVAPEKLKWFENADFRRACSMATNRAAIVRTILFGEGAPLYGPVTPSNKQWYNPDIPKFPYDPAKAAALLDQIGLKDRDGDGVREDAEGNRVEFTIVTNKENNIREKVGVLLKEDLTKIGLKVQTQLLDFNDLITRTSDSYDYEACLLGTTSGVPPHPSMSANTYLSSGRLHAWNPEQKTPATPWEARIDELYNQLKRTFDEAEQKKLNDEIQAIFGENQPLIQTAAVNVFVAARNTIGNVKPSVLRPYLTHNIPELYIK